MKYLGLHLLIWALLCLICTLVKILLYILINIGLLVWKFQLMKWDGSLWESGEYWDGGIFYKDKTPIDTFWRYYYVFKNKNK